MTTLTLLSGGAVQGLVTAIQPRFTADTGCELACSFGAVGAMRAKLVAGAPADLVLLTAALVRDLVQSDLVRADSIADIGAVPTAVAVRTGDALPEIGTGDGLRRALLAADAIFLPDPTQATAGIHFADVIRRLGIAADCAGRLRPHPNGAAAMRALAQCADRSAMGCTQASEILIAPGVTLVGALPQGYELAATYTAAITKSVREAALAAAFLKRLTEPSASDVRRRCGFA